MDKKFQEQKDMIEALAKQVSELQFSIETLKKTQENSEIQSEVLTKSVVIEEANIEEPKFEVNIDEIFNNCFSTFSESNKGLALKTMKMWFSNILTNPTDKQKSRINITNPQYKNYFAGNIEADKLFDIVGFELKGNFLEFEALKLDNLKQMLDKITENINALPLQVFSNSAP